MDGTAVKLAPSILSADFARLGDQVVAAEQAGADRIHVDVMDGHFVPNLSMGAAIVQSLRRVTQLPIETHLMVSDPDRFLEDFSAAGSDSLLVHWEGNSNLHRTVQRIRALGKRAGVVINPATASGVLEECASWSRGSSLGARWKWMGASTRRRRPWSFGPAPPCWWRARPSSAPARAWPPR
jgi:ribulose-phosphate 3-epimerase